MKKTLLAIAMFLGALVGTSHAQLLFTQYYEGTATNKWLEITNIGTITIDLTTYAVGQWNNANAEGYKTGVAPSFTMSLTGTLDPGKSLLLFNTANTTPTYAVGYTPSISNNSVINFNGNDSVVLYTAGTYSTSSIIDAIGFTSAGNEGADKSFVRLNADIGYNLIAGSTVLDFPSVWANTALADVNSASANTDPYVGYSSVAAVPEPGTVALVGIGLGAMIFGIRRRRNA